MGFNTKKVVIASAVSAMFAAASTSHVNGHGGGGGEGEPLCYNKIDQCTFGLNDQVCGGPGAMGTMTTCDKSYQPGSHWEIDDWETGTTLCLDYNVADAVGAACGISLEGCSPIPDCGSTDPNDETVYYCCYACNGLMPIDDRPHMNTLVPTKDAVITNCGENPGLEF